VEIWKLKGVQIGLREMDKGCSVRLEEICIISSFTHIINQAISRNS
jgi:hypothetical protein